MASSDAEFEAFVAARGPALLRTAFLLAGNQKDGEDLLQSVLAKTYVAWPRLRSIDAAEPYVRVALARSATTWWRRRQREVVTDQPPDREAAGAEYDLDRSDMWRLLQALPPRQRAVLVLRYYEGLSEAEIAETLRCSRGTVKSQASKALGTLRHTLNAVEPGVNGT